MNDELMDEPEVHQAYFQFGNDEPILIGFVAGGEFSLTLKTDQTNLPEIEFQDGKGKTFKLFLKQFSSDGI